ncbi:hypothetical protein BREVUG8_110565 [Brevundimonas sp. G8]|nr:hypothetical protein BREVUG8_110565 [Brevundimonas sp. G8]
MYRISGLFAVRRVRVFLGSVRGFSTLAASLCGEAAILGEASLLAGDAGAPFARDFALTFGVHGGETSLGNAGGSCGLAVHRGPFSAAVALAEVNPVTR